MVFFKRVELISEMSFLVDGDVMIVILFLDMGMGKRRGYLKFLVFDFFFGYFEDCFFFGKVWVVY